MCDTQETLEAEEGGKEQVVKGTEYQGTENHRLKWFHVVLLDLELLLFIFLTENVLLTTSVLLRRPEEQRGRWKAFLSCLQFYWFIATYFAKVSRVVCQGSTATVLEYRGDTGKD